MPVISKLHASAVVSCRENHERHSSSWKRSPKKPIRHAVITRNHIISEIFAYMSTEKNRRPIRAAIPAITATGDETYRCRLQQKTCTALLNHRRATFRGEFQAMATFFLHCNGKHAPAFFQKRRVTYQISLFQFYRKFATIPVLQCSVPISGTLAGIP